ncbi:MAG TPA: cupredoxin domain-containing protein [Stellaceae bacterium]|nr:cupredoxin domain-containing protein [Stellaceae bacterium]
MTRGMFRAALAALVLATRSAAIVVAAESHGEEQHVSMLAMKFDYLPDTITVKKGKPVVLELSTLDRIHGFDVPGLGLRTDIPPGPPTILRFTPKKAGTYNLHCDNFCGDGHEGMTGQIIVTD